MKQRKRSVSGFIPTVLQTEKFTAEGNSHKEPNICTGACVHPPVQEGGEDADAEDAEGQVVEDVGQEHLPFAVKAVLTLLITDGSQRRNCPKKRVRRSQ